jgi:hypothetical protein
MTGAPCHGHHADAQSLHYGLGRKALQGIFEMIS